MPVISFKKNRTPLIVNVGTNLMNALLDAGIPVASSCRGDGVCAKCKLNIIEGMNNLTPENPNEAFLRESKNIPPNERLSCQVQILGDITIDATYW